MTTLALQSSYRHVSSPISVLCSTILLGLGLLAEGCSFATERSEAQSVRGVNADTVVLQVVPTDNESLFRAVIDQASVDLLQGWTELWLSVTTLDSLRFRFPVTVTSMGAPGRSETVTSNMTAEIPASVARKGMAIELFARKQQNEQTFTTKAVIDTAALKLTPSIEQTAEGIYRFILRAERRRNMPDEYFPSSEQLRVTIVDRKGSLVWTSNEGLAFLTMIMPVEPMSRGSVYEYVTEWNGTGMSGEPLQAGRYNIQFLLPVKPSPYSESVDITLPIR